MSTKDTKKNDETIDAQKLGHALRLRTQIKAGMIKTGSFFPDPSKPSPTCTVCGQG